MVLISSYASRTTFPKYSRFSQKCPLPLHQKLLQFSSLPISQSLTLLISRVFRMVHQPTSAVVASFSLIHSVAHVRSGFSCRGSIVSWRAFSSYNNIVQTVPNSKIKSVPHQLPIVINLWGQLKCEWSRPIINSEAHKLPNVRRRKFFYYLNIVSSDFSSYFYLCASAASAVAAPMVAVWSWSCGVWWKIHLAISQEQYSSE